MLELSLSPAIVEKDRSLGEAQTPMVLESRPVGQGQPVAQVLCLAPGQLLTVMSVSHGSKPHSLSLVEKPFCSLTDHLFGGIHIYAVHRWSVTTGQ